MNIVLSDTILKGILAFDVLPRFSLFPSTPFYIIHVVYEQITYFGHQLVAYIFVQFTQSS